MLTLEGMRRPDHLRTALQSSQALGQKTRSLERVPPHVKQNAFSRIAEGAIGGAMAGASMASAFDKGISRGDKARGDSQGLQTPPQLGTPGAFSNSDGTYGVNTDFSQGGSLDNSLPGPGGGSFSWLSKYWD